jgi:LacI family transcriptional regulator
MSVVGYGDVDFAAMLSPTLTSIRQPKYELGRAAAGLLIAETVDPLHRHGDIRFEPELIERQSTSARSKLNRYDPRGA